MLRQRDHSRTRKSFFRPPLSAIDYAPVASPVDDPERRRSRYGPVAAARGHDPALHSSHHALAGADPSRIAPRPSVAGASDPAELAASLPIDPAPPARQAGRWYSDPAAGFRPWRAPPPHSRAGSRSSPWLP